MKNEELVDIITENAEEETNRILKNLQDAYTTLSNDIARTHLVTTLQLLVIIILNVLLLNKVM